MSSSDKPTQDSTSTKIMEKDPAVDDLIDEDSLLEPKDLERPAQKGLFVLCLLLTISLSL